MATIELLDVDDRNTRKLSAPWSIDEETAPSTSHSNIPGLRDQASQILREQGSQAPLRLAEPSKQEPEDTDALDPNAVAWDGPNDPQNPMNWPEKRKWSNLIALSIMTFLT